MQRLSLVLCDLFKLCTAVALQAHGVSAPFASVQKFLRMHAAFIAGDTLYVGHYQQELDDDGVWDINEVLWRLRWGALVVGLGSSWAVQLAGWLKA